MEILNPIDILIGDKTWQQQDLLSLDEQHRLWAIITSWQRGEIGATEAIGLIDGADLFSPDDWMLGIYAVAKYRAENPPVHPGSASASRPYPASPEVLEVVASVREGRAA